MKEIRFQKYRTRGTGYHWEQISKSLFKRNVYVVARYKLILDLIENEIKDKKVLDIGCGDGVLSYLLALKGASTTGIDTSEEAVRFAKEKCKDSKNMDFLVASAYKIPFEDKSFDYIVSSDVIEHLKYPEKMVSEIKRVWNKKGKIIITSPIRITEKPLDRMHCQEFFEEELKKLFKKYFEDIKIIKSHPLFWIEFQNKVILRRTFFKYIFNMLNLIFGFNPFMNTKGWRYYTLQTVIISNGYTVLY